MARSAPAAVSSKRAEAKASKARAKPRKPALPRAPRGARERASQTVQRLAEVYPAACELDHRNAFELTIATILSAQTTDKMVNSITPELFARYPTAADLAAADPADVERIIKPTGFFRNKTKAILACAQALVGRFGGEVPPRMEDLVTLPGIGRKTANVILGVAFDIPGFAVDTHVTRLSNRLGLVNTRDPEKIEAMVTRMVPPVEWTGLSLRLILHGRRVCDARRPRCEECVLNDYCTSSLVKH
ncbi:MAG TPA: endonuclease III [Candidatus Dormibacteraeota bacterium]|nr:endonuclease III [Candidatus Dormibacteraeota bacterium]